MKIYTKGGDKGETGLFGGKRVSKDSIRIEAYGSVDELNSFLGLAEIEIRDSAVKEEIRNIQNQLFDVGADLATPDDSKAEKFNIKRISEEYSFKLEKLIDEYDSKLDDLKNFILPGGSKGAAMLHVCRTIARRAERNVVSLSKTESINKNIVIYLNRLSDLFFVLSRFENKVSNIPDIPWENK